MDIAIGQSPAATTSNCFLKYLRGTGSQNHIVQVYSGGFASIGFVGQGYVGQQGATIATPSCVVDLGHSTFGENGAVGALNPKVNFSNANASGNVQVWQYPMDRQGQDAGLNPSPLFPIKTDDFSLGDSFTVTAQQTNAQGFTIPIATIGKFAGTVSFGCNAPAGVAITCPGPVSTAGAGPLARLFR